jgi:hypothetical protein
MQTNNFLKSFDKNIQKQIHLDTELKRIQSEQQVLFDKKLDDAEKKLRTRLSTEFEEKYKTDLQNVRSEILARYSNDIQNITQKFSENQTVCITNCTEIIKMFLQHHLLILNKNIINQDVKDTLNNLLRENQQHIVHITGNHATLETIQQGANNQSLLVAYMCDETMIEGDIKIESQNGGVYFSLEAIMSAITEMCNTLSDNYFNI